MKYWIVLIILIICFTNCKETGGGVGSGEEVSENILENKAYTNSSKLYKEVDFDGLKPRLSTQSDSTYVVNFWATWCKPCIKELPYFQELSENYKSEKVKVLLVSLDFPNKYESLLKPYIKEHNIQNEVLALNDPDSNSWIPQVDESWSGAIPATIIFNKNERKFYEQSFTYDELENQLKSVINN